MKITIKYQDVFVEMEDPALSISENRFDLIYFIANTIGDIAEKITPVCSDSSDWNFEVNIKEAVDTLQKENKDGNDN